MLKFYLYLFCIHVLYVSQLGASISWSSSTAPNANWKSLAADKSGQYAIAAIQNGGIYYSADYGNSWATSNAPTQPWQAVASASANVNYKVAVAAGVGIYTSCCDYGYNWTKSTAGAYSWSGITSDSTGKYLAASASSGSTTAISIYTSSNYGITWVAQNGAKLQYCNGITSDSTGKYLTAIVNNKNSPTMESVYLSGDYGVTWTFSPSATVPPSATWISIASNAASITYMLMGNHEGGSNAMYYSNTKGFEWAITTLNTNGNPVYDLVMSSTGNNAFAAIGQSVYVSNDFGRDWTNIFSGPQGFSIQSLAIDENGYHLMAAEYGGGIYTAIVAPTAQPTKVPSYSSAPSIQHTKPPTFSPTNTDSNGNVLSDGEIAGIVVGTVVGSMICLCAGAYLVVLCAWRLSRKKAMSAQHEATMTEIESVAANT